MPQNAQQVNPAVQGGVARPLELDADGNLKIINAASAGQRFYVNEATGDDDNAGTAAAPFASLAPAQAASIANNGDIVFLMGTVHALAPVVWAKNGVHLIGLLPPSQNSRSRISQSGSDVFSPLIDVTAQGCAFLNLGTFHGFASATAQVCWKDEGGRNYYNGVLFGGGGNATAAAQAGMRSLLIAGGTGENLFQNCEIGLDTIVRATNANASLELTGGSPRNKFVNCLFQSLVSAAGDVHVLVGSGGIDRWLAFVNCQFLNAINSTGTAMTAAMSVHAAAGGSVLVDPGCVSIGATKISAAGPVYVGGAVPTGATSGLAVAAA